jgi:hypothetical protein
MNLLVAGDVRNRERSSTSAGGPMHITRPVKYHIIVLGLPFDLGTASKTLAADVWEQFEFELRHTTSGYASEHKEDPHDTVSAIFELRLLTGLTWDQLARLFRVARRSLHFWASGKALNAANEEQLYRTLAAIRAIDRGGASENRTLLFQEHQGQIPFDLLAAGRYDELVALVGSGPGRAQRRMAPLSPDAQAARAPLPPEVLANALQDTVHRGVGRGRATRTVKARRRGRE